jgi:hypothetical protein
MLFEGTVIGADGKRHPAGEQPTDPAPYRRRAVLVHGDRDEDDVPVWDADEGRFEWGTGGGGPELPAGVAVDGSAPSDPAVDDLWVDTSTESPVPKRWDGSDWVAVGVEFLDPAVTNLAVVTQAAYDGLEPPDPTTAYFIVASGA